MNNLKSYDNFVDEAETQIQQGKRTRRNRETTSQIAHKNYLAHIYADRKPKDPDKMKRALKKNLEFERR
jgi:hypothetical protein